MISFTFDTETWRIAPGRLAPRLVCMSYVSPGGRVPKLAQPDDAVVLVRQQLSTPDVLLVGHNVAFDFGVLCQHNPRLFPLVFDAYRSGRVHDTMIWEKLYTIARGWAQWDPRVDNKKPTYSLEALVKLRFGEEVEGKHGEDAWRLRYQELDGKPFSSWPRAALQYALNDATLTDRIYASQIANPDEVALVRPDFSRKCYQFWALHLMSAWGLRTDGKLVERFQMEMEQAVRPVIARLKRAGIYRPDGTKDVKALRARVALAYRLPEGVHGDAIPEHLRTPAGALKTDRDTLEQSDDEGLHDLAKIGEAQTNQRTYIPVIKSGVRWPINARANLAETGRVRWASPNTSNIPREGLARLCYVPRDGYVYVGADYSGAELCTLAQTLLDLFGHSEMARELQAGRDLHKATGAAIMGITYEEMEARCKAKDPEALKHRKLAKPVNFGFGGGMGAQRFVETARKQWGIKITVERATELKLIWLAKYLEMRAYFSRAGQIVESAGGKASSVRKRSGRTRGGMNYCDFCNDGFQPDVADGALSALAEVSRQCYTEAGSPLWGSRPVLFIHDEIIMETPTDRASAAGDHLAVVMKEAMAFFVPDIPVEVEPFVMRRWDKRAETVRDSEGRLVVWEPEEGEEI